MATSGDQEKGSSELDESDTNCSPCQTDGSEVAAVGYCVDCKESLCQRCFDVHLIPSVTRKHVLSVKESTRALGAVTDDVKETISRTCPQHDEEVINYHCPNHSFFGCQFCFYKHQKTCKDVKCIPEVCQDLENSVEYKDFTERLISNARKCMDLAAKFESKIETIQSVHAETVTEIQDFKREVVEEIDMSEKNLLKEADRVKNEDSKKATEIVQKCDEALKANREISSEIERLQNSGNQTDFYIAMVESNDKLKSVEEKILSSDDGSTIRSVSFKKNSDFKQMFSKSLSLGQLDYHSGNEKVQFVMDVNIKSKSGSSGGKLVGSALFPTYLVITDEYNKKVKVVDHIRNELQSELKLSNTPLGVCKISDTHVAVAEWDKIVFVIIEPTVNIEREFAIAKASHGIAYHNGQLVVSYSSDPRVEIMDMHGKILNTFKNDDQGQPLFSNPYHVAINRDTGLIYVSNSWSDNVVCMKFDGTIVAKYTDNELKRPWQVIFDSCGMVYVCGENSNNVHQMTADCKKVKIIASQADGLQTPRIISFVEDQNKLIIGGHDKGNALKMFSAKYTSH